MPAPTNTFKNALQNKQTQIGCWVGLADAYSAEISATAGFDWLLIDGEHAPNDIRSISAQLQVINASDSHPVVRVPIGEEWILKQVLDVGAQNILIPMIESGEQAQAMVDAVTYPPTGRRGVGSALARASNFAGIPDYLQTADEQICLLLQVENRAGLKALDDILAVDGVDGVFIGPSDLAADMGYLGQPNAPEVVDTVLDAIKRIKSAGKAPGVLAVDTNFAKQCLDAGAMFVATGIDVTLFANTMRALAKSSRTLID